MIHLLASSLSSTVHVVVSWRTFVSTIAIVVAFKFGIHTGAAILPAGGTIGVAMQPDHPDEASCKKRAGDCRECFHFTAVNPRLELARKRQYGHEDNWPEVNQSRVCCEREVNR